MIMKLWGFAAGMALGMTAATVAVTAMYPVVGKKMKRDGKKLWKGITSMV
ncbi:MAG: hypothetical protein K6F68_00905 [Clostridiales bacterium]|nr:hypothetical protein [Clostridiales bacterium]